MTDTFSGASLAFALNQATQYDPYIAMLFQDPQRTAKSFTVDASGWLTLAVATPQLKIALGKRVSIATAAALPGQSQYFMLPHSSDVLKFKICLTLADALAGTAVAVANGSTGTVFDEALLATDALTSLVSYEHSFSGYYRAYSALSSAVASEPGSAPKASRQGAQAQFTNNTASAFECTHVLALFNGSSAPGSTSADYYGLTVNTGITAIPAYAVYNVNVAIEAVNG